MQPHAPQPGTNTIDRIVSDKALTVPTIGAAVLAISTALPWLTTSSGPGNTANAYDQHLPWFLTGADLDSAGSFGHGLIYLGLAIAALVIVWRQASGMANLIGPLAAVGVAGAAIGVLDFVQFTNVLSDLTEAQPGVSVSVGFGLYMAIAGSGAIVAAYFLEPTAPALGPQPVGQQQTAAAEGETPFRSPAPQTHSHQQPPQPAPAPEQDAWWN